MPLARMTRPRCGTRVKVVRPVRWLHSLVTDRIAIIGRMMAIGKPVARVKVLKVRSSAAAKRITPIVASSDAMPMLASSQKPGPGVERLAQLDGDDPRERNGLEGRGPDRARGDGADGPVLTTVERAGLGDRGIGGVMAVMRLLLRGRCVFVGGPRVGCPR